MSYYTFPLAQGSKLPAVRDWPNQAKLATPAGHVGIFTGKYGDGEALIVIDVDCKSGKPGYESLLDLELNGCDLPPTAMQKTPSGGVHYIYRTNAAVRSGVDVLAAGLDIRSAGGYVCHYGIEGEPAPAPQWLLERLKKPREKKASIELPSSVNANAADKRAIEFLQTAPVAIEGMGGDLCTYRTAAHLKDLGVTQQRAVELIAEHWNPRCEPPWSLDELEGKIKNAYQYGKELVAVNAPEAQFESVELSADNAMKANPLEEMNKQFAFCVDAAGGSFILSETLDHNGRPVVQYMDRQAFHGLHANKPFASTGRREQPISEAWMQWAGRRTYAGVVFAPGRDLGPRFYNLWRGFGVEPMQGDWSLLRDHLLSNVCAGNQEHFDYLMKWAARMVQQPATQGCTAIVLRGDEGGGKGIFARALRKIMGRHGIQVSNAKHILGAFNEHLHDKVYLFADEAFFAGDRAQEGVLKSLVTEDKLIIEPKGRRAFEADNYIHLMIATNSKWAVPASAQARRFFVLDVEHARMQDSDYFGAMQSQLDSGGYAAMLHDLQHLDLTGFDVFAVPKTKALAEQKDLSLRGVEAWLREALSAGQLGGYEWEADGLTIPKEEARSFYSTWLRNGKFRGDDLPAAHFSKEVFRVLSDAVRSIRPRDGQSNGQRAFKFSALQDCRKAFDLHMRQPMDWEGE